MHNINVNQLEIRETGRDNSGVWYEFYVDGENLAGKLGIVDRSRCMEFSGFDLDYIKIDPEQFPHWDSVQSIQLAVDAFLGKRPPDNQFGSGRVVLYRCHCGCDYCGVISFQLTVGDNLVQWQDMHYENDAPDGNHAGYTADDLAFDKQAYYQVFADYLATLHLD